MDWSLHFVTHVVNLSLEIMISFIVFDVVDRIYDLIFLLINGSCGVFKIFDELNFSNPQVLIIMRFAAFVCR